jgi:LytS/YehU family sensor histidine kinase
MLRFVLYKGPQELVKLQDEIDFLENYIDLMRIRYIDKIDISFTYPNIVPSLNIPTLLIVPFVENAFKHGVSYEHKSFIHVKIECSGNRVLASIVNSKGVESMQKEKEGGIGIENTKRRLQLIYGDDYQLTIKDEKDTYNVELNIKAL